MLNNKTKEVSLTAGGVTDRYPLLSCEWGFFRCEIRFGIVHKTDKLTHHIFF